jgi:hypothetical protein
MSEGDIFREVEEDLRREQFIKAWDRYGAYIIAGAFVIIALAAGYNLQKWRASDRAAQGGDALTKAVSLLDAGKQDEGLKILNQLAVKGPGSYSTLAKLQLAAEGVRAKDKAAALKQYQAVADDASAEPAFRDFARVQMAALNLGSEPYDKLRADLDPLAKGNGPFRFSARELIGLSAFRAGKMDEAEKIFGALLTDSESPAQMRQRAEMMLSLLAPKTDSADKTAKAAGGGQDGAQNAAKSQ